MNSNRARAGGWAQKLQFSTALALTVATVASAQNYRVLKRFAGNDGRNPRADLVLAGNTLYGTTQYGGNSYDSVTNLAYGVVFRVNTDGSGYTVLKDFSGSDGARPQGGLVLSDNVLYGTTTGGGSSNCGVIFRMGTDGSNFAVLKSFTGPDGCGPGHLVLSGSTLYGTTSEGGSLWGYPGSSGYGVVFRMNTDGSGFTVLQSSDDHSPGWNPVGALALAGSTLYGTTWNGGAGGIIFKVNTDGSSYTALKLFWGLIGLNPRAGLILADNTLYGTTDHGGSSYIPPNGATPGVPGGGVVFRVNTDGSGYAVLKSFTLADLPQNPQGDLALAKNTLFGTTPNGGSSGVGTVFKVNTDGSGYGLLKSFVADTNGAIPQGGVVFSDGALYGTTWGGGNSWNGVVFALTLVSITKPPLTQTAEVGTAVGFRVEAASAASELAYQWFFNEIDALVGATNAFLELTNVLPNRAGAYTVVVTSFGSSVTSPPALLNVIPPVERRFVPALQLGGETGSRVHVEFAESIPNHQWSPLSEVILSGSPQLCFDLSQRLSGQRFYRAWQTNGPQPGLGATMATEIPLAGTIGSSARVDYINQIGPTDAWVTLDTVVLTNTTQLYYDAAFGQPTRLYRVVTLP